MFDKRLMALCPESKKYIVGNIVLQWLELCMNAVMIGLIAVSAERLYRGQLTPRNAVPGLLIILMTIIIRFFVTRYAVRMSYLASRTVKRKLRELIYKKLLRLGMSYREKVTTAEIVQESVEGVDQLESYFGQYVPQFFYAFIAPLTLLNRKFPPFSGNSPVFSSGSSSARKLKIRSLAAMPFIATWK